MDYVLEEPFFDIKNDFVIGEFNDRLLVFKNNYPEYLFLGPFTENDPVLNRYLYIDFFARLWKLNLIEKCKLYVFDRTYGNSGELYIDNELEKDVKVAGLAFRNPYLNVFREISTGDNSNPEFSGLGYFDVIYTPIPKHMKESGLHVKALKSDLEYILENSQVNHFEFTKNKNTPETIRDRLISVGYNNYYPPTDQDHAGELLTPEFIRTLFLMYLLGVEFTIDAFNMFTGSFIYANYEPYLTKPTDKAPFTTYGRDKVTSMTNDRIRDLYELGIAELCQMNLKTGMLKLDEAISYRFGVLIALCKRFKPKPEADIRISGDDSKITVANMSVLFVEKYTTYGDKLLKNQDNVIELNDTYIYDRGETILGRSNLLDIPTTSGYNIEEILKYFTTAVLNGELQLAIKCAFEVYRFITIQRYDIVQLLYNKILEIAGEYTSPRFITFHTYICDWYNNTIYEKKNDSIFMRAEQFDDIPNEYDPRRLIAVIYMLCYTIKTTSVKTILQRYKPYIVSQDEINLCKDYMFKLDGKTDYTDIEDLSDKDKKNLATNQCVLARLLDSNDFGFVVLGNDIMKLIGGHDYVYTLLDRKLDSDIIDIMRYLNSGDHEYLTISMLLAVYLGVPDKYNVAYFEDYKDRIISSIQNLDETIRDLLIRDQDIDFDRLDSVKDFVANTDEIDGNLERKYDEYLEKRASKQSMIGRWLGY